jgi:Uma2 family endonuclease
MLQTRSHSVHTDFPPVLEAPQPLAPAVSTAEPPGTAPLAQPSTWRPVVHKLTVEAYHALWHAGHLAENDRIELVDGLLIEMPPLGHPHMTLVNRLTRLLVRATGDDAVVSVQNSVSLPPWSEPQPDFVLFAPRFISVAAGKPTAADVLLVIEVSDSSLRYDRGTKLALYAQEGLPEFWIVDVTAESIEVCRRPALTGDGVTYTERTRYARGEHATVAALPNVAVSVDDVFG